MRRPRTPVLVTFVLLAAACDNATTPSSVSIAGSWESVGFTDANFRMTMVETARAVEGAGHRAAAGETTAFRIVGANTGRKASLLLDFDGRDDINFEGEFEDRNDETTLEGALFGGGYAGDAIVFRRDDSD
ncbi:MAG TPA: hypothetical protein VFZ18_07405 [Longimicrobiaceae bacterium]